MNYTYHQITLLDLPFLHRLFKCDEYHDIFFEGDTTMDNWIERFEKIKSFQIAYDKDERIGVINTKIEGDTLVICLIAIEYRLLKQGTGLKIMKDIFQSYPHKRYKLEVKSSNQNAVTFYKSLGFITTGEHDIDLGKNGIHHYLQMERIEIKVYNDQLYENLINLHITEENKLYVSSPNNILYKHLKNKDSSILYTIHFQNKLIGTLLLKIDHTIKNFFIWQFLIDSHYQYKNYGKTTLNAFINELKATYPNYTITLTTKTQNYIAQNFFKDLGFIELNRQTEEVDFIFA